MSKREEKINRLWRYLQKTATKETLEKLNMRAFLYSVGRLSYEQVLVELVSAFYGKEPHDPEVNTVIQILENKEA